jgi:hypothetical protein
VEETTVTPKTLLRSSRVLRRTLLASVVLAGAALALGGASPSHAAPVAIADGTLSWGVRSSFRSYIEGSIAHGQATTSGGATRNGNLFEFPAASGTFDGSTAVDAEFAGAVRFTGHDDGAGPVLDVTFSDLRVVISGTTGWLYADATYTSGTPTSTTPTPAVLHPDVQIAALDLAAVAPASIGATGWRWTNVPAALTADGALAFASLYPAGSSLDPVSFTVASAAIPKFQPLTPARLLDTRAGGSTVDHAFEATGPVTADGIVALSIADRGGVPADAAAVALNVTVAGASGSGYVTVWPCGAPQPNASSLNFVAGQTVPNAVITKVGDAGKVCLFVAEGATDLIADVTGYFPTGSAFTSLTPARVLDTRTGGTTTDNAQAALGPRAPGSILQLPVATRGGVPADAAAVVLNVTVTAPQGAGYVTVWPCGAPQPNASSLNFDTGQTVPNAVVTKVGAAGKVCLFVAGAQVDLLADVNGFFPAGSDFASLTPARLLDTRQGGQTVDAASAGTGARLAGSTLQLQVVGRGGVAADASAVVLNVTVAAPQGPGYVTVWPCGAPQPNASSLNFVAGQTVANAVVAKIGDGGKVCFFVAGATADLLTDVTGAFVG